MLSFLLSPIYTYNPNDTRFSPETFCQIQLRHLQWLCKIGEELERQCEFAAALKFYFAGKVYYAKIDGFASQLPHSDSASINDGFRSNQSGFYQTMCRALQEVAKTHRYWAETHPGLLLGSWADEKQKENHLKDCLNIGVSDAATRLEAVRQAFRAIFLKSLKNCFFLSGPRKCRQKSRCSFSF
jgi:hypothetical protein